MEPRPRGRGNTLPSDLEKAAVETVLQWSPDLAAGETRRLAQRPGGRLLPSMEPRPRGRGNDRRVGHTPGAVVPLQWSPDLAAGETRLTKALEAVEVFLQWSPDLAAGETAVIEDGERPMAIPSMEPRPRGRGNPPLARR